jgi:hypothetical protein
MIDRISRNIGGGIGLRRRGSGGGLQTVLVAGAAGTREPESADDDVSFFFDRLMDVAFKNTFYNVTGSLSPDFSVVPTRRTEKIMKSLGMLFRDWGAGFSVLYDTKRTHGLLRYLRRHNPAAISTAKDNDTDDGAETRLSFTLNVRNPNFYYFTDISYDFDVGSQCYYASNQMAHIVDGRIVLTKNEFVPESEPLPTVGGELDIPFPEGVTEIQILDVLGNVVQCYPRHIPVDLFKIDPPLFVISCQEVEKYLKRHHNAVTKPLDICTINFFLLPAGRYTIRYVGGHKPEYSVIYRAENEQALCFIDLFMTDPVPGGAGIYPVRDLYTDKPSIIDVVYNLNFQARSTRWGYYIVPPAKSTQLHDLHITGTNGKGDPVAFSPARQVTIGFDTNAYLSYSEMDLQLQSNSECVFKLSGRIQNAKGMITRESTLMPRLPVAPPNRVEPIQLPENTSSDDGIQQLVVEPTYGSAIYVYL